MAIAASVFEEQPAKPFLKWVGGKRQLLPELVERYRRMSAGSHGRYFEPFLGGGALFFHLRPASAVLSDTNARLIRTYRGVRNQLDEVLARLKHYDRQKTDKAAYYRVRGRDIDASDDDAEVAAWLIYLNRTGYNGLYRVNSKNRFNVPFGRYKNPGVYDPETLRRCSEVLAGAKLVLGDFAVATSSAKKGDFVYFDPPYVPLSTTSSFASYTKGGFGPTEQERLRDVALALKKKGVRVLLSNSSAAEVRRLYRDDFEIDEVQALRLVNSNASRRGSIAEVLIY